MIDSVSFEFIYLQGKLHISHFWLLSEGLQPPKDVSCQQSCRLCILQGAKIQVAKHKLGIMTYSSNLDDHSLQPEDCQENSPLAILACFSLTDAALSALLLRRLFS